VADFKMRMFNADGSEGKMCGNGIRCVAKYVYDYHLTDKNPVSIETLGGIKTIDLSIDNGKVTEAKVDMGQPETRPRMIPMITDHYIFVDQSLVLRETTIVGTDNKTYKEKFFFNGTAVSMGNPHFVVFVPDVDALDLEDLGPQFEHHKLFPEGVNTEFVQIIDENTVKFRVWERGSGETLACGTGACAVNYACMKLKKAGAMDKPLNVQARGGMLKVTYESGSNHIYLQGPAVEVFSGEIEIPEEALQ
jgi:diaminopimelate epimerase